MTRYKNKNNIHQIKKASAWTQRASITIEAALAVPIFFFASLLLIYQLEIRAIEVYMDTGANNAAKIAAKEMYVSPILNPMKIESDMIASIGNKRLDRSIVEGTSDGINCSGSYADQQLGVIYVTYCYHIKLPVPSFAVPSIRVKKDFKIKAWTGYEKNALDDENSTLVYITDHQSVYHKDYHCTYLQLSVHMVPYSEVGKLRNQDGGKYHACAICGKEHPSGCVYITDDGDCYHTRANCSGLKRTIHVVPLSQVKGKGACSRCGQ